MMQKDKQGKERSGSLEPDLRTPILSVWVAKYFLGNVVQVEYFAETKKRGEAPD